MKRYDLTDFGEIDEFDDGDYVALEDAQAAIEAARREGYRAGLERGAEIARGHADERAARLAALIHPDSKADQLDRANRARVSSMVTMAQVIRDAIRSEAEKVRNG